METRIDARIDEYVKAFNELSGVVGEDVAVRILDNLGKDRRCETIDRTKNKVTVKNPDDPASEKQKKLAGDDTTPHFQLSPVNCIPIDIDWLRVR